MSNIIIINNIASVDGTIANGGANYVVLPTSFRPPVDDFFNGMYVTLKTSVDNSLLSASASSTSALLITDYEAGSGKLYFKPSITDGFLPKASGEANGVCVTSVSQLPIKDVFSISDPNNLKPEVYFYDYNIKRTVLLVDEGVHHFAADPTDINSPELSPYNESSSGSLIDGYIAGANPSSIVTFKQNEILINESKRIIKVPNPAFVSEMIQNMIKQVNDAS